jgi:hypothetical protein
MEAIEPDHNVIRPTGIELCTKAVVASCVVFVPIAAVGAVGVPVNAGELNGAALEVIVLAPVVIDRPVTTLDSSQLMYEWDKGGQSKAVPEAVFT